MPGESNHQVGLILYAQRQYEAASVQFRLAIGEEETCARWNDWASAELACGREVRAEWGYRRALHFDPVYRQAAVNLAVLLIAQGRLQESVPILTPHAHSFNETEKAVITNLVMGRRGLGVPVAPSPTPNPPLLLDAFQAVISLIPNDDPSMPADLRAANRRRMFDSRHYVEQCCELLKALPLEVQPLALAKLQENSKYDYRLLLVLACHSLAQNDAQTALSFARQAIEARPYDNHVQRLLIQADLAATPEESRAQHPWAGLDEYLKGCFCDRPWRQLELSTDGALHVCCPGWLAAPIGNAPTASAPELWNSPAAQEIRKSILDGSFKYCGRIHCAWISCRALRPRSAAHEPLSPVTAATPVGCNIQTDGDPISSVGTAHLPLVFKEGPREIVLSHDRTCNLACRKCRQDFYFADGREQERLAQIADRFLEGILNDAYILRLDGAGEVFASRHCRQLLKRLERDKYPKLRFMFMTNGLLFDRRTFDELDLRGRIHQLSVSIDAAQEETYRVVQRGGDFQRLLANLEFADALRIHGGEDFGLDLAFVVSALNFREMPEFVRLGKRFHAAIVGFNLLRNQSGFTAQEFRRLDIANPTHPEHGEFLKVLADKELSDPCVGWGTLGYLCPCTSFRTQANAPDRGNV
jgi:hypothetical protein